MIYAAIVACEAAFWLFLLAGLACRYVLRSPRLGAALLLCVPLVDLLLLVLTAVDLTRGHPANIGHALATLYLGFTIAFGPILVAWADSHFAHRFLGAPLPEPAPSKGWPALLYELFLWARCLAALALSSALLAALEYMLAPPSSPRFLRAFHGVNTSIALFWLIFGPGFALPSALAESYRQARSTHRLR